MKISKASVLESLKLGRKLLVGVGWIQKASQSIAGYCATGCVEATHFSRQYRTRARICEEVWRRMYLALPAKAKRRLAKTNETCGVRIVAWNDTAGRTKDEVLALFDRTIANVKRGGKK